MASPFASVVMPVWQDPFVQVIKFGMTHRNVGWHAQGDVEQTQDQHIHKNVFRIRGAIAATNYLRVPRDAAKGMHGLGLTGRYAYMQIRRIGDLPMTIHLDFVTNKKTALRFTLSSIYQLLRSTGTALRVPLSLDARWTVVVIDMVALLELHSFNQYARETYRHLKTITLCASMNVRNFFVSPTLYTPSTLPSTLRFPENFGDQYRWLMLPSETNSSLDDGSYRQLDPVKQEDLRIAATPKSAARVRRSSVESTRTIQNEVVFDEQSPTHESAAETITKVSPRTRDTNLRRDRNDILSKADQILRDAGIFDVNTDTTNNQQPMDAAYQSPLDSPAMRYASLTKRGLRAKIVSSSTKAEWPDPILELDRVIGFSNDFPRMLLWLPDNSACVYTSSSTIIIREFRDENTDPTRSQRVSTEAVKGSVETTRSATATREHFLYGHSVSICALAVSSDGGLLASAEVPTQTKKQGGVRLWGLASRECVTVVKAQPKGVHTLCFSTPSKRRLLLCVVGRDECFRTQIFIWDCSCLRHGKEEALSGAAVSLMARQTSDFPIDRIAFSPYEQQDHYHLVSCGRENIRYWRVNPNTGHLTGCPVILNEYSRGTVFTDIGFDTIVETHPSDIRRVRPLYVASSLGTLLVIDYDSKQVMCVYQLHDASINCLSINEGFCVTGSDDCFLRVWPLDFTDFFLEAHHEAGVSCLDVSPDGMKVLVGSRNNAIGLLDIADQQYATLLRSHTKDITAMAPAPWGSPLASLLLEDARSGGIGTAESELVTASSDGTLRVWDALSGYQLYEFDMQQERVTSLAASPVSSAIVAVGFASGCTRIFDVHRTPASGEINTIEAPSSMLREFRQHQSSILHVEFDIDAEHLFTSGAGKQLCLYDARQQDYLPLKMLLADFDPEDGHFVLSHDKKWLAVVSGDRKNIVMVDPCSLRVVATVQPPKLPGRGFVQSMPLLGQDGISALVTSANAKYMATGGVDGSLRVWNWDDRGRIGRMHQSFIGHAGKVKDLAFTKDDKRVVATGESTAICIWQFHGDSSPMSPRAKSGSMDIANIFPFEEHDSNQEMNGIDNDRYCYFYDLHRNTFIATTQLLLLSSKTRNGSSQPDNKPKTAASTRKVVEFMEWVTTAGKSLLITGSRSENALYVHGLPMVSTKHSARVQVDWQRVARAGVSLLCKVVLNGSGMLRSLSVDPARDAGIATTEDGTIVLVHFSTPPTTKVLRETATVGADCNIPFAVSNASWALDGAVLLSMAQNDNSIRVWLPELSREIASFQVESAICTCFAVKPFSTTPDSVPQSMVMAGYSDGSLRVFDLCEMRLLSRFELAPSFAKSARYDGGAFDRIIFVGALTALIVTKDNCVLLVDVSNALEQTEEAQSARGANIRPKRVNARVSKKSIQENSRLSRARTTGGCREGREVVYRELTLLPSSYRRRKRLPGLAKSEEVHVEVGAIDVMTSGDTNIHPFLIVVKYTGPIRYGEGRCVIKVFAEPTMSVLAEDDVAATDEWRLHSRPDLEHSVAVFMADSTSKSVRVLHSSSQRRPDSTPTETSFTSSIPFFSVASTQRYPPMHLKQRRCCC
ncbi:hypothetical protein PF001_g14679 [Phytophthora fragariae]|uniref:CFA20 domain-containing protein n=1 Tax=Phytophthora fragariae TaxID=53985 RepID=A0A6A4D6Q8_9STRA|nr:hypothetical protein PF001_g14679 [Phytophthora fragariae]